MFFAWRVYVFECIVAKARDQTALADATAARNEDFHSGSSHR